MSDIQRLIDKFHPSQNTVEVEYGEGDNREIFKFWTIQSIVQIEQVDVVAETFLRMQLHPDWVNVGKMSPLVARTMARLRVLWVQEYSDLDLFTLCHQAGAFAFWLAATGYSASLMGLTQNESKDEIGDAKKN